MDPFQTHASRKSIMTSWKWKHFPRYWPFGRGIHRSPVDSPNKGQWHWALMFSLICTWKNGWANNPDAGYLRRHCAHYDFIVMSCSIIACDDSLLQSEWLRRGLFQSRFSCLKLDIPFYYNRNLDKSISLHTVCTCQSCRAICTIAYHLVCSSEIFIQPHKISFFPYCPACRTTLVATRFRVAVICPIIQVPHCIRVFFYFVWFVFINHIFQFYNELCTYCNILDIYLS